MIFQSGCKDIRIKHLSLWQNLSSVFNPYCTFFIDWPLQLISEGRKNNIEKTRGSMWFGRENDENVVRTRDWCGWPSSPRLTDGIRPGFLKVIFLHTVCPTEYGNWKTTYRLIVFDSFLMISFEKRKGSEAFHYVVYLFFQIILTIFFLIHTLSW